MIRDDILAADLNSSKGITEPGNEAAGSRSEAARKKNVVSGGNPESGDY